MKRSGKKTAPVGEKTEPAPRTQANPASLANLRPPWRPGESGNPGGKPAIAKEIRELAQCDSPEAYAKVVQIMRADGHKQQLAAAIAILKVAGVSLGSAEPAGSPAPTPVHFTSAPTPDLEREAALQ